MFARGLATIFISIYATFAYYHLAALAFGFVMLVLTCAFAVVLSLMYNSVSMGLLGFAGAVLTALLLQTSSQPSISLNFPYLLLVSATAICYLAPLGLDSAFVRYGYFDLVCSAAAHQRTPSRRLHSVLLDTGIFALWQRSKSEP